MCVYQPEADISRCFALLSEPQGVVPIPGVGIFYFISYYVYLSVLFYLICDSFGSFYKGIIDKIKMS